MPRFLHTPDWQIGRQYSQFAADDAVPLAQARLTVVETIARLATEHKVDAVLVAGDVFDAQTVADRTIRNRRSRRPRQARLPCPGRLGRLQADRRFTCHPAAWRDLGVAPRTISTTLSPSAAEPI